MAILQQRLNRKNETGSYDEIHLKTDATNVSLSPTDETTVKTKFDAVDNNFANVNTQMKNFVTKEELTNYDMNANELILYGKRLIATSITGKGVPTASDATFEVMASNIDSIVVSTGSGKSIWVTVPSVAYSTTFSATKGGTTVHSSYIGALGKAKIELPGSDYIGTWTVTGTFNGKTDSRQVNVTEDTNDYFVELVFIPISGNVAVGNLITFDNKTWRVVHNTGNQWYLALSDIVENTQFGSNNAYKNSTLAGKCVSWQSANLSATALEYCNNVTVENVTNKVFIPTYAQVNGGFSYYNSNANRICQLNGANSWWWTSSPGSGGSVYRVYTDGTIGYDYGPSSSSGFRPHVCITLQLT